MKVRGEVFSGVLRGTPLIEKYYPRFISVLGFRPYEGTMDIRLEQSFDIRPFSTKRIEHVLQDGKKKITAYLAPVKVRKISVTYNLMNIRDNQKQLIKDFKKFEKDADEKFSIKSSTEVEELHYECWAVQFKDGLYGNDVMELIAKEIIKEKLGIEDGDKIEIEFSDAGKQEKIHRAIKIKISKVGNSRKNKPIK